MVGEACRAFGWQQARLKDAGDSVGYSTSILEDTRVYVIIAACSTASLSWGYSFA